MTPKDYIRIYNDFWDEAHQMTSQSRHSNSKVTIKSLSSLSIKENVALCLHVARHDGAGDNSCFFVEKKHDREDLYNNLIVKDCPQAAWELYLLMSSSAFMPCFWHGAYNQRRFIFSLDQLAEIDALKDRDTSLIGSAFDLSPSVTRNGDERDGSLYEVQCCYWNDWKGLIKETVRITIDNGIITSYEIVGGYPIYEYDCGILL